MTLNGLQLSRALGSVLGGAVGDVLGVPYEGKGLGRGVLPTMAGGGFGDYDPGEWSDDTQMSVCIVRVLADGHDLSTESGLDHLARSFHRWYLSSPADIGIQTSYVFRALRGHEPSAAKLSEAARSFSLDNPTRAAGNGGLMRTSSVVLAAPTDRNKTAHIARSVCELTHADPHAGDSCVLWTELVRVMVTEGDFVADAGIDLIPAERQTWWASRMDEAMSHHEPLPNDGWTVGAWMKAFRAVVRESSFEETVREAIWTSKDTDTVAAIAGALAGARSAVPDEYGLKVHGWPGPKGLHWTGRTLRETARAALDARPVH